MSGELDKLLGRYSGPRPLPSQESRDADVTADTGAADASDDAGCFGVLRGTRERTPMLELRRKDGSVRAIAYSYIDRCDLGPPDKITLHAGGTEIVIAGRNLNAEARPGLRLFASICRHRCVWVAESSQEQRHHAGRAGVVVESIRWEA